MKVVLGALLVLCLVHFGRSEDVKLPIQIYYGALCPDSIRFFQNQLYPIFENVTDFVDFLYVPFGKASSRVDESGSVVFQCQQGPNECSASRVQLCGLFLLDHYPARKASFAACQMSFGADQTGETCANQVGIPFESLAACYNGQLGEQLLLQAEERTKEVAPNGLAWVPTTVYNWEFDQDLTDRSEFNLLVVICEQIQYAAPACVAYRK